MSQPRGGSAEGHGLDEEFVDPGVAEVKQKPSMDADEAVAAHRARPAKPAKPPRTPKSAQSADLAAVSSPGAPAQASAVVPKDQEPAQAPEPLKAKKSSPRAKTVRDPGGYPEFHAPTRTRSDGKAMQTIVFLHGGNVANWSWDPQVRAFSDYEVLTPHLPGFGARAAEDWVGLDSAADDVAAIIADEVSTGGVHLVGLSLGGVVALRVVARHPELIDSLMLSGVPAIGVSASMRKLSRMQLKLFSSEWFWRFQAGAYGMIADEKDLFADHGTKLRADNMRAIMDEVDPGGLPQKLEGYQGPVLVLAGGKEPKLVSRSFPALGRALPQAQFRTAAGRHHQWNIEDPILFNATVRSWIEKGIAHTKLQPVGIPEAAAAESS